MQKSLITDLTKGNVLKQLLRFAAPLILANILQMVYNIVDMVIIGQFVGTAGISAVANGGDILMVFASLSMGCCSAGQIIVSQYVGKNDRAAVNKTIGTMMSFMVILAICLSVISLCASKWALRLINTPVEAFDMAVDYTAVCFTGLIFIFGYNAVSAIMRGMGDGKRPLIFIAIASAVNLILDLLFVAVFKMSAFGAALATVIGQGVAFIFSIFYLYKRRKEFGFDFRRSSFKIDPSTLGKLVKLGLPIALQQMAIGISGLVVNTLINSFGVVASSVAGIGAKLRMIIMILCSSLSTAASSMIGQNVGAGKYDRVRQVFRYTFIILFTSCFILALLGVLFPRTVFGFFGNNADVLAMAGKYMWVNFATYMAFAFMQPGMAIINGIGNSMLSLCIGITDGVICRIGFVLLAGVVLDLGVWGIWWAATAPAYVTAIISLSYFASGKWKTFKPIINR
ncbi:MAG: MATE family efflux transporter [Oscillospiraceae bacterium]|nr:MATE family efflux transporter [Oscillospiraceae bacterium]